jgi:hypothetical protein
MDRAPLSRRADAQVGGRGPEGARAGPRNRRLEALAEGLRSAPAVQRLAAMAPPAPQPSAPAPNRTGLPDRLKQGLEGLSGLSLDHVQVHYNSPRPAQLKALAFAQGRDIHLAPGQAAHLPHEAWHVVQQAQGRVRPVAQLRGGIPLNDDSGLEREADRMGARALIAGGGGLTLQRRAAPQPAMAVMQARGGVEFETSIAARITAGYDPANFHAGWVPQDQTMLVAPGGWKIDSDNSKLEFVTEPPVGLDALPAIIDNMLDTIAAIPTPVAAATDMAGLLGLATLIPYTILPYQRAQITGAPQGTIGIPFDRLYSFFALLEHHGMGLNDVQIERNQAALKRLWNNWRGMPEGTAAEIAEKARVKAQHIATGQAIKADTRKQGAITPQNVPEFARVRAAVDHVTAALPADLAGADRLKGMLHFIGQYLIFATTPADSYEKKRFPVMARSSFASMYAALGADAQAQFGACANALVARLGFAGDTALFPARVGVTFDVDSWFASIAAPAARLIDAGAGTTLVSDRMTAPGAFHAPGGHTHATDRSMGSMGLDGGLVVLELRNFRLGATANSYSVPAMRQLAADLRALHDRA